MYPTSKTRVDGEEDPDLDNEVAATLHESAK